MVALGLSIGCLVLGLAIVRGLEALDAWDARRRFRQNVADAARERERLLYDAKGWNDGRHP